MRSTFFGLETAKRGMSTQQSALHVLGNNISNANTPGYSRQRANLQTTTPFPAPGMQRPFVPGQMGTGVEVGTVERVRDTFIDLQFRNENSKLGFHGSRTEALKQMEEILNEPTTDGLANQLNKFWQSIQDLSVHPQNQGARSVMVERGVAIEQTFKYINSSLTSVQKDLKNQLDVTAKEVNSTLNDISSLNKQIADAEAVGDLPNDLYDRRDLMVDKLAGLASIKVSYVRSGGLAPENAQGRATIELVDKSGSTLGKLIDGLDVLAEPKYLTVQYDNTPAGNQLVKDVKIGRDSVSADQFMSLGKISGLISSYGYIDGNGKQVGTYPEMLKEIDSLAKNLIDKFNTSFRELTSTPGPSIDFFKGNSASSMSVAITLNQLPTTLDSDKLINLSRVIKSDSTINGRNTSILGYYQGLIGDMGVKTQEAERLAGNSETLLTYADGKRQQVSGVSLDEEMVNMIKFQHAYNAASRNITVIDEMLDKIINGMGIVGR
jgi:flagellar hook-associated protein 1